MRKTVRDTQDEKVKVGTRETLPTRDLVSHDRSHACHVTVGCQTAESRVGLEGESCET